jgi:hypothetical protein
MQIARLACGYRLWRRVPLTAVRNQDHAGCRNGRIPEPIMVTFVPGVNRTDSGKPLTMPWRLRHRKEGDCQNLGSKLGSISARTRQSHLLLVTIVRDFSVAMTFTPFSDQKAGAAA